MIRFDLEATRGNFVLRTAWQCDAQVAGFYGPTGCGKTTLLHLLAGLQSPDRGRIEVDGGMLLDDVRGIDVPPERRGVGLVFQDDRLFPHLSVRENLRFGRPDRGRPGPSFEEVVALLDLEPLLPRGVKALSGGERRLVAVGRALLARPRLLLLDEPLTGLDPSRRRRVLAYLLRLKQRLDLRMLLVSHVFSDFLALADEMALLEKGLLTTTGPPRKLLTRSLSLEDGDPLETVLEGIVLRTEGDTARVLSGGARFDLALPGAVPGAIALISLGAQEVIVGVGDPPRTSARNVLSGRITEIHRGAGSVFLAVDAGPVFWAQVTEDAVRDLGFAVGSAVYALIKTSALRGTALPFSSPSGRLGKVDEVG